MRFVSTDPIPPKPRLTKAQLELAKELGRIGGLTRAHKLTADERKKIAIKASKAAAKVRAKKAKKSGKSK